MIDKIKDIINKIKEIEPHVLAIVSLFPSLAGLIAGYTASSTIKIIVGIIKVLLGI